MVNTTLAGRIWQSRTLQLFARVSRFYLNFAFPLKYASLYNFSGYNEYTHGRGHVYRFLVDFDYLLVFASPSSLMKYIVLNDRLNYFSNNIKF